MSIQQIIPSGDFANVWNLVIVVVVMDSWCYLNMHLRCKTSCSFSSRFDCRPDSLSAIYRFSSISWPTCNGRTSSRFKDETDPAPLANCIRWADESNWLPKSRLTFPASVFFRLFWLALHPSHIFPFCYLSIGSIKETTISYPLSLHQLFMYL